MKNDLQFNFEVDKAAQTVTITREFNADQSSVWDAFTKAEILDQWWAPKPLKSETKHMNFEEGGRRFYAMVMVDGEKRWSVQRYKTITPKTNFTMFNCFSDAEENLQLPGSDWDLTFSEADGVTTVKISVYNESLERLEMLLDGFTKGMKATLENLDEVLASHQG